MKLQNQAKIRIYFFYKHMMQFPSVTVRALPVKPSKGSGTAFTNSWFLVQGHDVSVVRRQAWSLA